MSPGASPCLLGGSLVLMWISPQGLPSHLSRLEESSQPLNFLSPKSFLKPSTSAKAFLRLGKGREPRAQVEIDRGGLGHRWSHMPM